jgi:hypothetical protein
VAARHLLLDLAGVLCRFDSTARLERLAAASRLETAEVDERLYGSGIVDRCDRGELDAAGIRDVLREQLGLDCDDLELAPPSASEALPSETTAAPAITAPVPATIAGLLATRAPALKTTIPVLVGRPHLTPAQLAPAPSYPQRSASPARRPNHARYRGPSRRRCRPRRS